MTDPKPQPTSAKDMTHIMSFDLEDWFHLVGIGAVSKPEEWLKLESLVEPYTEWFLQALDDHHVRATFFIVGWIAERYPDLVKKIASQGHEVASHSHLHRAVYTLTPEVFREDLVRSIDTIEQIAGKKVLGFRAASFSIKKGSEWALDIVRDCGLAYDASLFPAPRGHGGYDCPRGIHLFTQTPSGRPIQEVPMSVMDFMGMRLPFSGGGYTRLLPWWLIDKGFKQCAARGRPTVVYLHPRDFAPDCPRVPMPLYRRFKCYVGLSTTKQKLLNMLGSYRFDTCARVLGIEEPGPVR